LCKLSGSAEPAVSVSCSAGLQVSGGLSAAVSYDVAVVRSVSPGNAGSSGSSSVTVVGALFGAWDRSAEARVHSTAAAGTGWVADSSVICRARSGLSWALSAAVSAGVQRGSVSAAVSYDAPSVSSAGVSNAASSGGMSVSVSGRGMGVSGHSAAGRVGGSACGASVWRSDSGLVCRSGAGSGWGQHVLVSAGVQRGSLSAAVSYNAPSVSSAGPSNGVTSGSLSVTVSGRGLANFGVSAGLRIGVSAASATFWISGSSVVGRCAAGLGAGGGVLISASLQGGSVTLALSYDAVKVSSVSLVQVAVSGASSVDLFGHSIGA
jgi:hypothetical protein